MQAKICSDYIKAKIIKKCIAIIMPFLILIINYFLKKNATSTVNSMMIDRKSEQISILQTMIFILTFLNQGIVLLLINTYFGLPPPLDVMDGDYTDFSDMWFRNLSIYFITPMMLTIFMPMITNFINWAWFEYFGMID